jgi:hypothetical protein
MSITLGSKLGCYEILAPLGVGGMGEVVRARDTKLARDVALKILPASFAHDGDRIARFTREAHVLASLNHPNIAAIYGFEDSTNPPALVLELVDGPTLAERIAAGPLALEDAVSIARQICDALEAAHDQGIVHRDLKPANVKVRPDGTVKVLDFGLAKALDPTNGEAAAVSSPTITSPALTRLGVILGTASYMSPEQARGRAADKRSDIWAFGCTLYEMLTGTRAFGGEELTDTLAAVLKSDPDWSLLPPTVPASVRTLIVGCLKRDRRDRIGDMSTVRFLLNQPPIVSGEAHAIPPPRQSVWRSVALMALGVALGAGVVAGILFLRVQPPPVPQVTRFAFAVGPVQGRLFSLSRPAIAISPDGSAIAYAADGRLFVRSMTDLSPRVVAGADQAIDPAFSPDAQSLAFWADSTIKRVALNGAGVPVPVCRIAAAPSSMSWDDSGILFTQRGVGILRVAAGGGTPKVLVPVAAADGLASGPRMLPGGKAVLFSLATDTRVGSSAERWDTARVVVQSLETGKRQTVLEPAADGWYVPTGHLVYALGNTLFARPFDLATLAVTGGPAPLVQEVRRVIAVDAGAAQFAISRNGTLAYVAGQAIPAVQQLFLFNRDGTGQPLKLPPGSYSYPRISPDGKRIAYQSNDGIEAFIAIYELSGTGAPRRITFGSNNRFPVWSPDNTSIVFQSDRGGERAIFRQSIDGGTAEPLTTPEAGTSHVPEAWSPNGHVLLFDVETRSSISLWMLSFADKTVKPFGDVRTALLPSTAVFSPDGHWVAYQTEATGTGADVVFVQPFPANGTKHQIAGGGRPLWSQDGKELFFLPGPNRLMSVQITTQPTFGFTQPVELRRPFGASGPLSPRAFDVTQRGQFVGGTPGQIAADAAPGGDIRVVLNWFEELKALAPRK